MKKNEFREIVDRELSSLTWDDARSRRVLDAIDRQTARRTATPMPRKLSLALVLVIVTMLLMATALAVALIRYSPKVSAENLARQALIDQYGLTRETLGLFRVSAEEVDGATVVTFLDIPSGRTDVNPLTGVYTVTVRRGKAQANWSHDDVDPALWQSGDLNAPAWGQPQLEVYLLRTYEAWPYIMAAMGPDEPGAAPDWSGYYTHDEAYWTGSEWLYPMEADEGDLPPEQARALARLAVKDFFGLKEEDFALSAFHETYLWQLESGQRVWIVNMWVQRDGVDMTFWVRMDAGSGEVLDIGLETGGNG